VGVVDREQAFRTLGLQLGATEEEIRTAFRRLVKPSHPDRGGDRDEVEEVIAARDSALASLKPSAVEPLQIISDLMKVMQADRVEDANRRDVEVTRQEQAERRAEAREESRRVSSNIVFTQSARYRELSRIAGILSAASVGIGFLSANSWLALFPYSAPLFAVLGTVFGISAWKKHRDAEDVKLQVEWLSESMTERAYYIDLLHEVLARCANKSESRLQLTRYDLSVCIRRWRDERHLDQEMFEDAMGESDETPPYWPKSYFRFRKMRLLPLWHAYQSLASFFHRFRTKRPWEIAFLIGADDFQRLLTIRGIEHGILEEHEILEPRFGRRHVVYVLASSETNA
jgi:hypothetical protein